MPKWLSDVERQEIKKCCEVNSCGWEAWQNTAGTTGSACSEGLTCFSSGFWHVIYSVPWIPAISHHHRPWDCGREDKRPLVVVLETVGLSHTVVHVKVCCQGDLLSGRQLVRSAPTQSLLTLAGWGRASLRVRTRLGTCIWEVSERRNVGLPVRTEIRSQTGVGGKGFLEHPRAKHGVAHFALVSGGPDGCAQVGCPCCGELTLTVELQAVWAHVAESVVG